MSTGFHHEALLYDGGEDFLAHTVPFVEKAVTRDEPILVAVEAPKVEMLRRRLGTGAGKVQFRDMRADGGNPGAIISFWREFAAEHEGSGTRLWGIGEPVWPERSHDALAECFRHECLLNLAFADAPDFQLMCPYDTSTLPSEVIVNAHISHPVMSGNGDRWSSDTYGAETHVQQLFAEPLPVPSGPVEEREFGGTDLADLRRVVIARGRDAGLSERQLEDAVLAVNELATNSVAYGGGGGTLRSWTDDRGAVWEVRDRGHIIDPLVGRQRPASGGRKGGFGLWIVNQLCDLVQVRSSDGGTTVRMHLYADAR